jgi:Cu/Ag efflux pump CusA
LGRQTCEIQEAPGIHLRRFAYGASSCDGPPYSQRGELQLPINVDGRLSEPDQFGQIVIKNNNGVVTRLSDVARVEIDASAYSLRSLLDNQQAVAIPIFQAPGSNAIQISNRVRATMEDLKQNFPEGLDYSIVCDPIVFMRDSIESQCRRSRRRCTMILSCARSMPSLPSRMAPCWYFRQRRIFR